MPIVIEVDCPYCGEEKLTWQKRVCKKTNKQIGYTDLLALAVMDLMGIVKPVEVASEIVEDVVEAIEEVAEVIEEVVEKAEEIAEIVVEKAKETVDEVKEALSLAKEPEPEPEPEVEPEPEPVERKDIEEIEEELKQL